MSDEMKQGASNSPSDTVDRRKFIGTAAMTAGMMFLKPEMVHGTAANSAVRVGLLGCGGRGTEDATNLVDTGGARVVALGDLFQDQLDKARETFNKMQQAKGYSALDESQLFVGPNAFQKMASSKGVDAILIATPPYFHPQHLEAAVAAGKHVYLEKPVAVDVPGALKVIEIGKRAGGEAEPGCGIPDPRLPALCGIGATHPWRSAGQNYLWRIALFRRLLGTAGLARRYSCGTARSQLGL